jgi:pimeloyl-ACP methyl ester carboxylesterase
MGAAIASAVAGEYPHRVSRILLEDPPWRLQRRTRQEQQAHMESWQAEIRGHQQLTDEALLAFVRKRSPSWDETELGPWVEAKKSVELDALQFIIADGRWQEFIPKIVCPSLLITADPDLGAIVDDETARHVSAVNPLIQVAHIPGAGHNIRREQFGSYMAVVKNFLARRESP